MMVSEYFRPTVNYSSWADRFSSSWTFILLLLLSLITAWRHYVGPNVTCRTPDQFTRQFVQFSEETCWMSRQLLDPEKSQIPYHVEIPEITSQQQVTGENNTRTLYQWLPLILALQALLFRLPDILLRVCESSFGFGCQNITKLVSRYNSLTPADRASLADDIARYLHGTFTARPLKFIPFGMITLILAFVKLLFFINAVTQLSILEGYLSPANVTSYGGYVAESIMSENYTYIAVSPAFPREIFCDLNIFLLSSVQRYTLQCLVPVNEFNEQICFFIWIWLLVVCLAAGTSGCLFLVKSLLPVIRQRYVKKFLLMGKMNPTAGEISSFSGTLISQDGVLILQMIGDFSSDLLVRDIVLQLWNINRPERPPLDATGYQGQVQPPNVPPNVPGGVHVLPSAGATNASAPDSFAMQEKPGLHPV